MDPSNLDPVVRKCIDDHLDAIEEVLRGTGMPRSERQGILADVQTQILEMLSARAKGDPSLADAQAVIGELDPPESYAREVDSAPVQRLPSAPPPASPSPTLLVMSGLIVLILGCILPFVWTDGRGLVPGGPVILTGVGLLISVYRPRALKAYVIACVTLVVAAMLVGILAAWLLPAGEGPPEIMDAPAVERPGNR